MLQSRRTKTSRNAQRGFTLLELLVGLLLIGLIASFALPASRPVNATSLDLAAAEVANAIRFARSEAMRVGESRGFSQNRTQLRMRVFSLDENTSPVTLIHDIYHPVDKNLYDRRLTRPPISFDGAMDHTRNYYGTCDRDGKVFFDGRGVPWCSDPEDVLLDRFDITLKIGNDSRTIRLEGISGRVTIL